MGYRSEEGRITALAAGLCLAMVVMSGCQSSDPQTDQAMQDDNPPPAREDYPSLQGQLFELATEQGVNSSGSRGNLTVENGQVQIVIEVQEATSTDVLQWAVKALGGRVETKHEALVQAWIPVGELLTLAEHPRVTFIRAPVQPRR